MARLKTVRATTDDIDDIIALASKIWKPAFAVYFSENELNSLFLGMYNPGKLRSLLQDSQYKFYFVKDLDSTVGYFAVRHNKDHLKLDKIYVNQKLQKRGIGKWIFEKVRSEAFAFGFRQIRLNVNRRNIPAINFYKNLGFSITGEEVTAGPNEFIYDDYIMTYNF